MVVVVVVVVGGARERATQLDPPTTTPLFLSPTSTSHADRTTITYYNPVIKGSKLPLFATIFSAHFYSNFHSAAFSQISPHSVIAFSSSSSSLNLLLLYTPLLISNYFPLVTHIYHYRKNASSAKALHSYNASSPSRSLTNIGYVGRVRCWSPTPITFAPHN
ncbi:hypothetical protein E2C01_062385 [Portunus trituberculatus]|uniref:Uncharacterized protein n=1 Tax=Portunus trituberculatus TaxID=210409 RepID=A0A5B7HH56_PORTR|nr:hypothetical protein [Portunus trituberculatus]